MVILLFNYLRFPLNEETAQKWLVNLKMETLKPSNTSTVCSDHFKESDINRTGQRVKLRTGAVPTRFKSASFHLSLDPNDPLSPILHDHNYSKRNSDKDFDEPKNYERFEEKKGIEEKEEIEDEEQVECVEGIECVESVDNIESLDDMGYHGVHEVKFNDGIGQALDVDCVLDNSTLNNHEQGDDRSNQGGVEGSVDVELDHEEVIGVSVGRTLGDVGIDPEVQSKDDPEPSTVSKHKGHIHIYVFRPLANFQPYINY